VISRRRFWSSLLFTCVWSGRLWAGGSGLNVVIVVNQNSTNSVQLGNYYREQRQIPPQNYLRINWAGSSLAWALSDFTTYLYTPLMAMLAERQLTNQIDYVVLSMDIPYQVYASGTPTYDSITSTLFYGFKPDPHMPCSIAAGSTNLYAGSEGIFRSTPPISASSNTFLVTMMTSSNLALAEQIVNSGVASDSTFPTQTVYLAKSSDALRNVRYLSFDNAVFNTRLRGNYSMLRTNMDWDGTFGSILGLQSGVANSSVAPTTFVPGALADNLTSNGGLIFEDGGQLNMLLFLAAGAAGTYGTVTEPCNYPEKFPSPQNYFYQARGFNLAECYYLSVTNPYEGLILGEPLAAPFAQPAGGSWQKLPANALLSGMTNLSVQFTASDANHPVQQVDVFLDGVWLRTLTNLPPTQNNSLSVAINGYTTNYLVPSGATILSVASNLATQLNQPAYASLTKVAAFAHGDRIELQSLEVDSAGSQVALAVNSSAGGAAGLTAGIWANGTDFLDTVAYGIRTFDVYYPPNVGSYLELTVTKTNNMVVTVAVTNTASGTLLSTFAQGLVNLINTTPALQGSDGVVAEDFIGVDGNNPPAAEFNLRARSAGWPAAQLQATLSGSAPFLAVPAGAQTLEGNVADLRPRAHLYVTAGVTNLPVTFTFDTTAQPNGYHELTAVAYEGSHVRTQKPVAQTVLIQNSPLSATFTTPYSGTNFAVEGTLQFTVVANTNDVASIALFSTGGALTNVPGQSSATFYVRGTNLDLGLHPFYAIVTTSDGQQYRTETKWIRLVGPDSPFPLWITSPPPTLSWPGTVGRSYDILCATNPANGFQVLANFVPFNTPAQWTDNSAAAPQRIYRVRTPR
jgi:uncharacterized protein (TIGR03790 family)